MFQLQQVAPFEHLGALLHFFQLQPFCQDTARRSTGQMSLLDGYQVKDGETLLKWKTSEEDEIPSASNFCLRISNVIWWRLVKVKTCQNVHLWMFKVLLHKNLDLRKPGNQRLRSNFLMWYLDDSCLVELPRQVKSCTRCYLICFHDSKNFRFHTSKAVLAFQNLTSLPSKSNSASKVIIGRAMNFLIAAFGHVPFAVGHLVLKLWSFLVGWKCQSAVYLWRGTKKGQLPGAK